MRLVATSSRQEAASATSDSNVINFRRVERVDHTAAENNTPARDSLASFLRNIRKHELLSSEDEIKVVRAASAGDQRAKERLIKANLRLVVSIAKSYRDHGLELMELIKEGTLGLEKAIARYSLSKGHRFGTYASFWIRESITSAISNRSSVITFPVRQNNFSPVNTGYSRQEEDDQSTGLNDSAEPISREDLHRAMNNLMTLLSDRERDVIQLKFGLSDQEPLSSREVAFKLRMNREQVGKLSCSAMHKLKNAVVRQSTFLGFPA